MLMPAAPQQLVGRCSLAGPGCGHAQSRGMPSHASPFVRDSWEEERARWPSTRAPPDDEAVRTARSLAFTHGVELANRGPGVVSCVGGRVSPTCPKGVPWLVGSGVERWI